MKITIHQPNYLPYLGFFDKMRQADIFVIYDDAQFNKEDFQHRNKFRIFHGWKWLTVPVEKKLIPIKEIKIRNGLTNKGPTWSDAQFKEIRDSYLDTPHYKRYENKLEEIYMKKYDKLIDLNLEIISFLMDAFNIKTKLVFSSELGFTSRSTQRLVEIVESLSGDTYLSGSFGKNYLDASQFNDKNIKLEFHDFKHPVYKQNYEGFIPNMSSIDILFNTGEFPKNQE